MSGIMSPLKLWKDLFFSEIKSNHIIKSNTDLTFRYIQKIQTNVSINAFISSSCWHCSSVCHYEAIVTKWWWRIGLNMNLTLTVFLKQSRVYVSTIQFDTYSITRGWSAKVLFNMSHPLVSAEEGRIEHALGNAWSQKMKKKRKSAAQRKSVGWSNQAKQMS